jgi:hypothetical protein
MTVVVSPRSPVVVTAEPGDVTAVVAAPAAVLVAANGPSYAPTGLQVNVKTDFGAVGNGVADDWAAIERAGIWLAAHGGGRMYFPTGTYLMPTTGKNLTIRSNIEYFGDGPSSVIAGSNAGIVSPNGAHFNVTGYDDFTYYPANAIAAGDRSVAATTAANAGKFKAGDIVMICSTGTNVNGLFYFMDINRVLSVNTSSGVISLEDVIEDGWSLGLRIANVTADFAQNYSVHDLKLDCQNGHPIVVCASYKSAIYNVWTHGYSVAIVNALVRSTLRDVNALQNWSSGTKYTALEIESGSVRANVHDIEISMYGSGGGGAMPLIYCQEFTRRTRVKDVRIAARGIAINDMIGLSTAGGHSIEDIALNAAGMDVGVRYTAVDPAATSHNGLPTTVRRVRADLADGAGSYNFGFALANLASGGSVLNFTGEDCVFNGLSSGGPILFAQGAMQNILFSGIRGAGRVTMNTAGLSNADDPTSGTLTYPLTNVRIENCEYTTIDSHTMLQSASFTGCRRVGQPLPKLYPSTGAWGSSSVGHPVLTLTLPSSTALCWGDAVHARVSGFIDVGQSALGDMHVALSVFGTVVTQLDFTMGSSSQDFEINATITLVNNSFQAPDKYVVDGYVAIDGVPQSRIWAFAVFPGAPADVAVHAWTAGGAFVVPKMAKLAFVPVESRAAAGI